MRKCREMFSYILLLTALFFFLAAPGRALAAEPEADYVVDKAELFDEGQKERLEELIEEYRESTGVELVVLTHYQERGRSPEEIADDFYDEGPFGEDGALFLICMDHPYPVHGDYWISTSGKMTRILTDRRIEDIGEKVVPYLSTQEYEDAAETFLQEVGTYVEKGIQSGQYLYDSETGKISIYRGVRWYEALSAMAVSAGVAAAVCMGVVREYAMKDSARAAANSLLAYRASAKVNLQPSEDKLINQFTTSRMIRAVVVGGGRGGMGGSSGRSTTHTSGGGRSHGGGGGRF